VAWKETVLEDRDWRPKRVVASLSYLRVKSSSRDSRLPKISQGRDIYL